MVEKKSSFLLRVLGNEPGKAIEQSSVNVTCRDDSVWNTTLRRCIECNPGFVGRNCSILCHYPQYGYLCSKRCENCSNGTCDHRTGCPESEKTAFLFTVSQSQWEMTTVTTQSTDKDSIIPNVTESYQTRKQSSNELNRKLRISVTTLGTTCAVLYMVYFGWLLRDKFNTRNNLITTNDLSDDAAAYQNMLGSDIVTITFE